MTKVYLAVTSDKYELPLAVSTSRKDIANMMRMTVREVRDDVHRAKKGKENETIGRNRGFKFIVVEIDDNDEGE